MATTQHSRVDAFHCIHKHIANARVHIQECYASAVRNGLTDVAAKLQQSFAAVTAFVKLLYLYYSGSAGVSREVAAEVSDIRRSLQAVAREVAASGLPDSVKLAFFDEITYAIGHLNNVEEHLLEVDYEGA